MHRKCWILVWQMGSRNCTLTVRINYRITDYKLEHFTYMSRSTWYHLLDKQTCFPCIPGQKPNNPVYRMCPTQLCLHPFTASSKPRDQAPGSYKYICITHFMHDSKNILWAYRHETGPWSISWHASGSAVLVSFIIWAVFLPASKKTRKLLELGQSVLYWIHRSGLFWCTLGLCCYETELICHSVFAHPIYAEDIGNESMVIYFFGLKW